MNKELIKNNFSRYAFLYDRYAYVQKISAEMLEKMLPENINNILEIGCGTGLYTLMLANKYNPIKIDAVDIAEDMIAVAKERISGVNFIVADAESIVLKERFDLITSNATMQWFENFSESLVKFKNALEKNGVILFSIFGPETFSELNHSIGKLKGENFFISSKRFPDKNFIEKEISENFSEYSIKEQRIKISYKSIFDLLKTIKYTGTRGKGFNFLVTNSFLNRLQEIYLKNFREIIATHQIFIVEAKVKK